MNRRLNPELFNPVEKGPEKELIPSNELALRQLQKEVQQTGKKLSTAESLAELLQSQIKTMSENENKRAEAFSKAIADIEKTVQQQSLEQKRLLERLNHGLKERHDVDEQIQSLIERFNGNISQFENKLAALKSTVSEKEMNLMSYREIIEQLVHDVEKLKSKFFSGKESE